MSKLNIFSPFILIFTSLSVVFFFCAHLGCEETPYKKNYNRYFESVAYTSLSDGQSIAEILLSDGTTWIYRCEDENQLLELEKILTPQKEFFITPLYLNNNLEFQLLDRKNKKRFSVLLIEETKQHLPQIVEIENRIIQPAGWFSKEKISLILQLSDGSSWNLNEHIFVPKNFSENIMPKVGDYLIITKLPYEESDQSYYFLMNL